MQTDEQGVYIGILHDQGIQGYGPGDTITQHAAKFDFQSFDAGSRHCNFSKSVVFYIGYRPEAAKL